jgi:hypothetical protein
MEINSCTTLTWLLTEAGRPEWETETALVYRRRFCVPASPRSGHLCGRGAGMLRRLCRLLVHPDAHQSAPRTPGLAASPDRGRKALAGGGRSCSHHEASRSSEGAGRNVRDQRCSGSSVRPVCNPVPDRVHARGGRGGAPICNPRAHRLSRASGPRGATRERVLPQ